MSVKPPNPPQTSAHDSGKTKSPSNAQPGGKAKSRKKTRKDNGARETIESIAIAFILAFLFKTFQAEAYVIPTGSMAPTLYGRHKEVTCDGCGFAFAVGASSEIHQESGTLDWRLQDVYCSNCGKRNDARDAAVFNGDRILVNKQVPKYKRFDVVVFKNPEQGHVNYIKRLVGLPNESIRIRKGDIWAKEAGASSWTIQRKEDPYIQKDIQLTVYDDDHPATELLDLGWPERWEPSAPDFGDGAVGGWKPVANDWKPDRESRCYAFRSESNEMQWLRYRHFLPNQSTWPDPLQERPDAPFPEASLIADFCSFNAYDSKYWHEPTQPTGIYWTGDLTLNATVNVRSVTPDSSLVLQLVEGPQTFNCNIDLNSGAIQITVVASDRVGESGDILTSGTSAMSGVGEYDVAFANVDDRICLWVNGSLVEFETPGTYESSDVPAPTQRDLAPCGIAVRSGNVEVSSLLLERDIYYRNESLQFSPEQGMTDYGVPTSAHEVRGERELQSLLNNPEAWTQQYQEESSSQLETNARYNEYQLDGDEYLMFGDNSSMSKDSRLFDFQVRPMNGVFSHRYAVREQDLIGKALYIFWPHGIPFLNNGEGFALWNHRAPEGRDDLDAGSYPSFRFPFYPNISRMKKIR